MWRIYEAVARSRNRQRRRGSGHSSSSGDSDTENKPTGIHRYSEGPIETTHQEEEGTSDDGETSEASEKAENSDKHSASDSSRHSTVSSSSSASSVISDVQGNIDDIDEDGHNHPGNAGNTTISPIPEITQDLYFGPTQYIESLGKGFHRQTTISELTTRLYYNTQREGRSLVYTSYRGGDRDTFERIIQTVTSDHRRNSIPLKHRNDRFIALSYHPSPGWEHFHSLHLCQWIGSSCRCGVFNAIREFRLPGTGWSRPLSSISPEAFQTIAEYHLTRGKSPVYCEVGGEQWRICREDGEIQVGRCEEPSCEGLVETCTPSIPSSRFSTRTTHAACDPTRSNTSSSMGGREGREGETPRSGTDFGNVHGEQAMTQNTLQLYGRPTGGKRRKKNPTDAFFSLMCSRPHTPIERLNDTPDIEQDADTRNLRCEGSNWDIALRRYYLRVNGADLSKLFQMQYAKDVIPVYSAWGSANVESYYEEKKSGKKNCILIKGPPNSGKNYFFDALCDFMLNPGKMENPHREYRYEALVVGIHLHTPVYHD
ncbi:hypothetical protein J6590_107302 [Homalodisca vitripennis]|nr:hypothetical protein J6590_107302 [Homalodisca vitripennis]